MNRASKSTSIVRGLKKWIEKKVPFLPTVMHWCSMLFVPFNLLSQLKPIFKLMV